MTMRTALLLLAGCGRTSPLPAPTGDSSPLADTTDTAPRDTGTPPATSPTPFAGHPHADLTDEATVRALSDLSAEYLWNWGYYTSIIPITSNDGCPAVDDADPYHQTITGGCTDDDGVEWTGAATVDITGEGAVTVTLQGFGPSGLSLTCPGGVDIDVGQRLDGTIVAHSGLGTLGAIEVDVSGLRTVVDPQSCVTTLVDFALQYTATREIAGTVGTTFHGRGRYADDRHGLVDIQTFGQLEDQVDGCSTEAEAGATLLSTAEHQVAILYDGAFACDDPGTSTWRLDGVPQGPLLGVGCASVPGGAGWLGLVPALLAVRRRR